MPIYAVFLGSWGDVDFSKVPPRREAPSGYEGRRESPFVADEMISAVHGVLIISAATNGRFSSSDVPPGATKWRGGVRKITPRGRPGVQGRCPRIARADRNGVKRPPGTPGAPILSPRLAPLTLALRARAVVGAHWKPPNNASEPPFWAGRGLPPRGGGRSAPRNPCHMGFA